MSLKAALAIGVLTAALAPAAHATTAQPRILYAGDWTGSTQIFAADPTGRSPLGQVTFDRPAGPCYSPAACGFARPLPSPDGRRLAYWSAGVGYEPQTLWVANADGTGARAIGIAQGAAWAPDSRRLAYSTPDTGIHVLTTTGADRIVDSRSVGRLRWSPDGKTLAFVSAGLTLLRGGHERVLVHEQPATFDWAPDGRRIAYATREGIYLVAIASGRTRLVYRFSEDFLQLFRLELAFAPSGRLVAFAVGGNIRLLDTRTLRVRVLHAAGRDLSWSPDGRRLLYVQYSGESSNGDAISTGDVQTVTPSGHVATVVSAAKPYGGQIVAAAWATRARGLQYRPPQQVDGVFAGGPVQELVADGGRAAFVACGGVSAWTPATGAVVTVWSPGECRATYSRGHVYSLALAGDRLAWWEKGWGLCFYWDAYEATIGSPRIELRDGTGCLGSAPINGTGTAVGAGSLLVQSSWASHYDTGGLVVDRQSVERVDPGGCPCPALSSSPGPYTPLDVDAGRIVVSGTNETRILATDGSILLSLPVPTLAAELSGSDLVLAAGGELRVYDAFSGSLRAAWPLPAQPAGHACDYYGDPSCRQPPRLLLGDVAHGLAAYVLDGQVHVLRLADGADRIVGPGTLARFADVGLVYADGARIRLTPFDRLPLR